MKDNTEVVCGFIDVGVFKDCSSCTVRDICVRINNIAEEHRESKDR